MAAEYWKWPETEWTDSKTDLNKAKEIVCGIDVGTTSTQAVILCDRVVWGFANTYTGYDFGKSAEEAFKRAAGNSGLTPHELVRIGVTGFGRDAVSFSTKKLNEVVCCGEGARFLFGPSVKTVVDLGAQTTKAIRLYEWNRLRDFHISDKCAMGFGRKIEMFCDLMHVPIEEIGGRSLSVDNDPEPVSTTCSNFAYPEAIGLLRQGFREDEYSENDVLAAFLFAIVWRVLGTIGKIAPLDIGEIRLEEHIAFSGGLAKNMGITKRLERELGMTALTPTLDPQLTNAIGAALLA